jgi:hypothetical protein
VVSIPRFFQPLPVVSAQEMSARDERAGRITRSARSNDVANAAPAVDRPTAVVDQSADNEQSGGDQPDSDTEQQGTTEQQPGSDDDEAQQPHTGLSSQAAAKHTAAENRQLMDIIRQQQLRMAEMQRSAVASSSPNSSDERPSRKEPRANELKEYHGDSSKLDEWLDELDAVFDMYDDMPDARRVRFGSSHLRDAARKWWTGLGPSGQSAIVDVDALAAGLRARFQPVTTAKVARSQLDALKQGNRHVNDYIRDFQRLQALVPRMSEEESVHIFERGLRSDLVLELRKADVDTIAAAIALAARIGGLTANAPPKPDPHGRPTAVAVSSSISQMQHDPLNMQQMMQDMMVNMMRMQQPSSDIGSSTNVLSGNGNGGRFQRGGRNGGNRFGNRPARQLPAIPGVSPTIVQQRWDAKQCLRCGSADHRAISCPNAIAAYGQGK